MWTDPKINSTMGLQATAATKRKHEITFDSKDANAYTSCPTPVKSSRWSTNANNNNNNSSTNNNNNNNNNNNINNNNSNINNNNNNNNNETTSAVNLDNNIATNKNAANQNLNIHNINNSCNQLISSCDDNSIAKLEVVAAVPCEPWNSPEPVDCISKLQAVAVPSDPWGSISTRSTLATTLLSADELDDDDDDFEDDYEEEESIIPTYCPLRYHPCGPSSGNHRNYSPAHSYNNNRPNYYSEPFPQQNCSRTGNQHLRMNGISGNGCGGNNVAFNQWNNSNGGNSFYVPPEASYPPQQTIRCAENGKSYLELGCSNSSFNTNRIMSNGISNSLDARHPFKRCCDGRGGTWCSTNKTCYKDTRLKIRNLSMFKLSRFRQVSEQSLYRSVLICNTLKHIDKEIETEAKELHHQQQQQQQHQQQQQQQQHHQQQQHQQQQQQQHQQHHHHQQLQHPIHSHLAHHHNSHHNNQHHNSHHHHHQHQSQQQQQQHTNSNDYSPIMGCARVSNVEYHHQNQFHSNSENRGDCSQTSSYSQLSNLMNGNNKATPIFNSNMQHQQQQQHQQQCNLVDSLHPYDHYPFREPNANGRATPFPNSCSSINASGNSVTSIGAITATTDTDSGYGDDDANRTINWSSVLSLSSQSALDPLNNNDLFSILPPTTITTSANSATTTPASISSCSSSTTPQPAVSITGTFTASTMNNTNNNSNNNNSNSINNGLSNNSMNVRTQSAAIVASQQTSPVQQSGTTTMTQLTTKTTPAAATSPSQQFSSLTTLSTSSTTSLTSLTTISSSSLALSASSAVAAAAASIAASTSLSSSSSFTLSNCSGSGSTLSTIATSSSASSSTWEYGFLEMDFGLGSEFTELVPSCKLSSDDLFKNVVSPVSSLTTSRYSSVHENELEQPAHIMVGS